MNSLIFVGPGLFFALSFLFFYLAVQQADRLQRCTLGSLHVLCIALLFQADINVLASYPSACVAFVIGLTVHTTSILFIDWHLLQLQSIPIIGRVKAITRVWSNIRRVSDDSARSKPEIYDRVTFLLWRSLFGLSLWAINNIIEGFFPLALLLIGISAQDFAPAKQGLLPPLSQHDLLLRSLISVHWIWNSYYTLNAWHCIFAVVFAGVLGWDHPEEWPPLFGGVHESFTLRRFWGVFWQRLHIIPFKAYTPSFVYQFKALRALWIFLLSAGCHVLLNWILYRMHTTQEDTWFFTLNYAVCLLETLVATVVQKMGWSVGDKSTVLKLGGRLLGYAWVLNFFVCAVPGWQYPMVYESLGV